MNGIATDQSDTLVSGVSRVGGTRPGRPSGGVYLRVTGTEVDLLVLPSLLPHLHLPHPSSVTGITNTKYQF